LGKERITLGLDPTPELVVEIDVTHGSASKLAIYARFGVPEVWLYAQNRMRILALSGQEYSEAACSRYFPALASDQLTEFMNRSQLDGQSKTLKAFRDWLRPRARGDLA
jgi:Uma2 family endonuclease